jgi:hypothetical protein
LIKKDLILKSIIVDIKEFSITAYKMKKGWFIMKTFSAKRTGAVIVITAMILLTCTFISCKKKEPEPPAVKTFDEQVAKDKERFLTPPQPVTPSTETPVALEKPVPEQPPATIQEPAKKVTLYFKELDEISQTEAERLLNVAVPARSIGRLPGVGDQLMVQTSRQIIQKWPDSWYAYRAKQMLASLPKQDQQKYKVTPEELDLSMYTKPRPGTQPFEEKQ